MAKLQSNIDGDMEQQKFCSQLLGMSNSLSTVEENLVVSCKMKLMPHDPAFILFGI